MSTYHFAFYISEKERSARWAGFLVAGAKVHGDVVEVIPQTVFKEPIAGIDGAMNLGLARAAKRIGEAYLAAGKHFVFFDKGYLGRGKYWRVSVDEWQPLRYFQRFMRPGDRRAVVGPRALGERRGPNPERVIVLAGACQNYSNYCNLGNVNDYNERVLAELREHTDRTIVYRPNPSWFTKHNDEFRPVHETIPNGELSTPDVPFDTELERCHLLVTHGSSASVAALMRGIPVMVLGGGICRPLALTETGFPQIEEPHWPRDELREQFFRDLAYCQWTSEEYQSGKAWEELRLVFAALAADKSPPPLSSVIKQYQLMHQHPNYFRGFTTLKYVDEIGALVRRTGAKSVLDYGSGKGEQYQLPHRVQNIWNVNVTCYDPAVEVHAKLPNGLFDGVICCDVMEHIPEEAVPETLCKILSYADKFVFFSISTDPATKTLPDGHNCHLTVRPKAWWGRQIAAATVKVAPSVAVELMVKPNLATVEA